LDDLRNGDQAVIGSPKAILALDFLCLKLPPPGFNGTAVTLSNLSVLMGLAETSIP